MTSAKEKNRARMGVTSVRGSGASFNFKQNGQMKKVILSKAGEGEANLSVSSIAIFPSIKNLSLPT